MMGPVQKSQRQYRLEKHGYRLEMSGSGSHLTICIDRRPRGQPGKEYGLFWPSPSEAIEIGQWLIAFGERRLVAQREARARAKANTPPHRQAPSSTGKGEA
jgi:hypothetical protein